MMESQLRVEFQERCKLKQEATVLFHTKAMVQNLLFKNVVIQEWTPKNKHKLRVKQSLYKTLQ
jgi:hypothetical protein